MNGTTQMKYRGKSYYLLNEMCNQAEARIITPCWPDINKEDVIFIHGLGGTWTVWEQQMSKLMHKYNVYSLDLPWSGRDEIAFKTIDELVEWFGRALETVPGSGGKRNIVAHSFGACMTVLHMANKPNSVASLILCSPFWQDRERKGLSWNDFEKFISNYRDFIKAGLSNSSDRVIDENILSIMAENALQTSSPRSLLRFFDFLFAIPEVNFTSFDLTTLLIVGDADTAVNPHCSIRLHQLISNSKLQTYKGAGHFPMHDCPDRFHSEICKFLEQ